ncbi:MAG TPA: amidohydrolase family protein [Phycisphaerales bacterium]|nr:amidohydrolase family protein [Phycisphaerales bacterium]
MSTRLSRLVWCAALAGFAPGLHGQDLGHKAPAQNHPVILSGATLHPVSGAPVEDGWIAFERGEITAMGSGAPDVDTDGEPVMLDGEGLHVWPGLISPYSQLGLTEIGAVRATHDFGETGAITPEVRAAVAVNPDSTLLPVTRSNGVLIAAVFPNANLSLSGAEPRGLIPGRAGVMRLDGWTWEDMAILPDAGLVVNFPMMRPVRAWWMEEREEDQEREINRALGTLRQFFDDAGAYVAARGAAQEQDESLPVDLRFEAMRGVLPGAAGAESDGAQKPVFFRANEYDQIVGALAFARERGLRPVIVGGRDSHLCLDLLKEAAAAVILESSFRFPKRDDSPFNDLYTRPIALQEAGVPYTFLSGDDTAHERSLPYAAALAVAHGLSPDDALRALTLTPAEIFGIDGEYGSLEPGKSATLIVTTGHPLEVLSNVELAFIDGRAIDLENKQTRLAAKYREKYRQLGLVE